MNLSKISSRKVPTQSTKVSFGDFKNHLNRKFNPDEPNRIWAGDITYLKVGSKWHYLCVVVDLFSRKVISWQLSDQPNAQLVINTFDNAVVEAFFKFLKSEETNRKSYSNLADLQISLFEYIDGFYNAKRPHSAINFLSPHDFEANFFSLI